MNDVLFTSLLHVCSSVATFAIFLCSFFSLLGVCSSKMVLPSLMSFIIFIAVFQAAAMWIGTSEYAGSGSLSFFLMACKITGLEKYRDWEK